MVNEGKKVIQTADMGSCVLLQSLILDMSMKTATVISWTLKTGSCYIHEGEEVNEKFIIRVN